MDGKRQYEARCAGCHGADGAGGGHGPAIVDVRRPRATTLEAVRVVIQKGIPEGGMPAFPISDEEAGRDRGVRDAFEAARDRRRGSVRLPRRATPRPASDSSTAKGNCASCHMVRGRGGVLGPDLSNVGRDRQPAQIEQALRDPGGAPAESGGTRGRGGRGGAPSYRAVTVRLRDGQTLRGIAKNESTFDLQLLAMDGKLHLLIEGPGRRRSFAKSRSCRRSRRARKTLRNLVAYLSRLSAPTRIRKSTLAARRAGRRAFRSPTSRIPSQAPGPPTTAT